MGGLACLPTSVIRFRLSFKRSNDNNNDNDNDNENNNTDNNNDNNGDNNQKGSFYPVHRVNWPILIERSKVLRASKDMGEGL